MSDYSVAVKLIVILAVIMLLANLMGVGPSAPFQSLQDTVAQGPNLPTFQDPFALKQYIGHVAIPTANYTSGWATSDEVNGCTVAEYFKCVDTPDGDTSYIRQTAGSFVNVYITPPPNMPWDIRVARIEIEAQVRAPSSNTTLRVTLLESHETVVPYTSDIGEFVNITIVDRPGVSGSPYVGERSWDNYTRDHLAFQALFDTLDLSFIRVTYYAGGEPECQAPAGAWFPVLDIWGCQLAQLLDWLITSVQFIANAIVYGFLYIVGWAVWFGLVIGGFLTGVISMALWFLQIDAPPAIQTLFAIMTVAIIGFFFLVIASLIRG